MKLAKFTLPFMENTYLGGLIMLFSIIGLVGALASLVLCVRECIKYIKAIRDNMA